MKSQRGRGGMRGGRRGKGRGRGCRLGGGKMGDDDGDGYVDEMEVSFIFKLSSNETNSNALFITLETNYFVRLE